MGEFMNTLARTLKLNSWRIDCLLAIQTFEQALADPPKRTRSEPISFAPPSYTPRSIAAQSNPLQELRVSFEAEFGGDCTTTLNHRGPAVEYYTHPQRWTTAQGDRFWPRLQQSKQHTRPLHTLTEDSALVMCPICGKISWTHVEDESGNITQ